MSNAEVLCFGLALGFALGIPAGVFFAKLGESLRKAAQGDVAPKPQRTDDADSSQEGGCECRRA